MVNDHYHLLRGLYDVSYYSVFNLSGSYLVTFFSSSRLPPCGNREEEAEQDGERSLDPLTGTVSERPRMAETGSLRRTGDLRVREPGAVLLTRRGTAIRRRRRMMMKTTMTGRIERVKRRRRGRTVRETVPKRRHQRSSRTRVQTSKRDRTTSGI